MILPFAPNSQSPTKSFHPTDYNSLLFSFYSFTFFPSLSFLLSFLKVKVNQEPKNFHKIFSMETHPTSNNNGSTFHTFHHHSIFFSASSFNKFNSSSGFERRERDFVSCICSISLSLGQKKNYQLSFVHLQPHLSSKNPR